jgi:hypothetical protein
LSRPVQCDKWVFDRQYYQKTLTEEVYFDWAYFMTFERKKFFFIIKLSL